MMLETARAEADPRVRILASWTDPGRYRRGALCVRYTNNMHGHLGMELFYRQVQDPPAGHRAGRGTAAAEPPVIPDEHQPPQTIRSAAMSGTT